MRPTNYQIKHGITIVYVCFHTIVTIPQSTYNSDFCATYLVILYGLLLASFMFDTNLGSKLHCGRLANLFLLSNQVTLPQLGYTLIGAFRKNGFSPKMRIFGSHLMLTNQLQRHIYFSTSNAVPKNIASNAQICYEYFAFICLRFNDSRSHSLLLASFSAYLLGIVIEFNRSFSRISVNILMIHFEIRLHVARTNQN